MAGEEALIAGVEGIDWSQFHHNKNKKAQILLKKVDSRLKIAETTIIELQKQIAELSKPVKPKTKKEK